MVYLLPSLAAAEPAGVCARRLFPEFRTDMARDTRFRLSLENEGGLFNGGVCWWHSRFQRAVWSLAEYRPDLPKATRSQAQRIIQGLAHFESVQIIPGYSDFLSFSRDYSREIQKELNQWQLRDGVLRQSWVRAISGRSNWRSNPEKLRRIMDELYAYSRKGELEGYTPWVMLQLKGLIGAHSALVIGMEKNAANDGYVLQIVDSNFPAKTFQWKYRYGDAQMGNSLYDTVPYQGLHRDVPRIENALASYCSRGHDLLPPVDYSSPDGF
jgi:hypothetical protein